MDLTYYRGGKIAEIPARAGIYAWYFKPRLSDWDKIQPQLSRLLEANATIETKAVLRYGLGLLGSALGVLTYASDRRTLNQILSDLSDPERAFVMEFLTNDLFIMFSRPIYIGITKNLNTRVFSQHYMKLVEYWDEDSAVNKYLTSQPGASVERMASDLSLTHSFALDARSRGISPNDLVVYAVQTGANLDLDLAADADVDDAATRRSIERVLQLLADPICGRR